MDKYRAWKTIFRKTKINDNRTKVYEYENDIEIKKQHLRKLKTIFLVKSFEEFEISFNTFQLRSSVIILTVYCVIFEKCSFVRVRFVVNFIFISNYKTCTRMHNTHM